jgi:hypothetical protein
MHESHATSDVRAGARDDFGVASAGMRRRGGSIDDLIVFDGACWHWLGRVDRYGLPKFGENRRDGGATVLRQLWMREYGFIPAGRVIVSRCPTRLCVNPRHAACVDRSEHQARERQTTSKLSWRDIRRLRAMSRRRVGLDTLAREFGLSSSYCSTLVRNLHWCDPGYVPGTVHICKLDGCDREFRTTHSTKVYCCREHYYEAHPWVLALRLARQRIEAPRVAGPSAYDEMRARLLRQIVGDLSAEDVHEMPDDQVARLRARLAAEGFTPTVTG